jgi:hypothetical protein
MEKILCVLFAFVIAGCTIKVEMPENAALGGGTPGCSAKLLGACTESDGTEVCDGAYVCRCGYYVTTEINKSYGANFTCTGSSDDPYGSPTTSNECTFDSDCSSKNTTCKVHKCFYGSCFEENRDDDNDGYYACETYYDSKDCNDTDKSINPLAIEICGDGKDNNCDGKVDEGCSTGSAGSAGASGAGGSGGSSNPNACDSDAACETLYGSPASCNTFVCENHECVFGPIKPEICGDGKDNNCDGMIDENCAPATPTFSFCDPLWDNDALLQGCCVTGGSFKSLSGPLFTGPLFTGTLFKGSGSQVYYYATDGKRYVFPLTSVLVSWYGPWDAAQNYKPLVEDASVCKNVVEIGDDFLASIPIGGNVTIRPGTFTTGIATDPKHYSISKGHVLHWMENAEVATKLYDGSADARYIDTPDAFFVNYLIGASITTETTWYDPLAEFQNADIEVEVGIKK